MKYELETNRKPQTIKVIINSTPNSKGMKKIIRLLAYDKYKPYTYYMNRRIFLKDDETFDINLPISPDVLAINVFGEDAEGNKLPESNNPIENGFKVKGFKKQVQLKKWSIKTTNYDSEFLRFAEEFSENAGIISTGIYGSDTGKFVIRYVDNITDKKTGVTIPTPARVNSTSKNIDVSKDSFLEYTVPMRILILLHEYSHVFVNDKPENETQADLNGLYIYLGTGYPRIEAHRGFLHVFDNKDTKQNNIRYKIIKEYIDKFDRNEFASPIV